MERQKRSFQIRVFGKSADGLVYSSDGTDVAIQSGIDSDLEAIADMQADGLDFDVDAEDTRSDTEQKLMTERLQKEEAFETTLALDTMTPELRRRAQILKELREIGNSDTT